MLLNCGVGEDSWESLGDSNQSILKEINPQYLLKGLMLKLKHQYFGHQIKSQCIRKDPDAGQDWRQEAKRMTEDETVGRLHWLDGHEFEQTPGDGEGQGSLACRSHGVANSWVLFNNRRVECRFSILDILTAAAYSGHVIKLLYFSVLWIKTHISPRVIS